MKKQLKGTVKSDKMTKSAVVEVSRLKVHPKYKKRTRVSNTFIVHNEIGAKTGDHVLIEETRPLSNKKHFIITKII
jgi:small subunit ribosomal protein S17